MRLNSLAFRPVVACEIEFYLAGSSARNLEVFWREVYNICDQKKIPVFKIEKERGHEQHEVALGPVADAKKAAEDCAALKAVISEIAINHGMHADFCAKPFSDQPGSGLHIHVHLEDKTGKNLFFKNDEKMSDELRFAIGGLLAHMKNDMKIFAPAAESQKRFVAGSNAPFTVSWGANNRTVALRLPEAAQDNKRIEHRVAGADADPQAVIDAVLAAMFDGIEKKIEPPAQIYGDAALEMYGLEKLV